MNTSRIGKPLAVAPKESRMPFNLLIAYEDQPTRHRALHLSHHLSTQFVDGYDFRCSWWKFDHLANEILREQATHAAGEANMIVLALNARSELSPLQAEWIQAWLPLRQKSGAGGVPNGALVALVATPETHDSSNDPEPRNTGQLRTLAAAGQLDFFSHAFELPKPVAETPEKLDLIDPPRSEQRPRSSFKMPIPRWGINE
jgi:hypothetical protein